MNLIEFSVYLGHIALLVYLDLEVFIKLLTYIDDLHLLPSLLNFSSDPI